MKKILFILSFFFALHATTKAEEVVFQASAPNAIPLGEAFRLVYSVNAAGGKDLRVADFEHFDVLAGPFESRSSSVQVINGNVNSSTTISYTYTLLPKKEGSYTIPAASIVIEKQRYTSNALTVKVLPADKASQATTKQSAKNQGSVDNVLTDENIFIRAIPTRTRLYEQDFLMVTYKMYTVLDVVRIEPNSVKLPDFKGFLKQEIDLPKTSQFNYETYNGRNFSTVVLYQTLLYPQKNGSMTIDKANFEAVVRIRSKAQVRSIFDNFFDTYQDVKKKLVAPSIKIEVDKLPTNKPATFNGAVGAFSFNSSISSDKVAVNDAITLTFTIAGNGNLKLIPTVALDFPADFEVYDPKVNNSFKHTTNGVTGTKTIEYLIIPRNEGEFTIPSYTFCFFDLKSKSYKEISSPEYTIQVKKGAGGSGAQMMNFANKEQLTLLGKDIRYIFTGNPTFIQKDKFFFATLSYWLWLVIPFLLSAVLFVGYRKQLKRNADLSIVKNRRANKVAVKRLKLAAKLLKENNKEVFYDEVLKALWGYLSDKLLIPLASLSKENVVQELSTKGLAEEDINEFMALLSVCEFERFSPMHDSQAMDDVYERTVTVISKFQENIK